MKVLLIIPAYNEEDSILNTVNNVLEYNRLQADKYGYTLDYIVIDDASTDSTKKILLENDIKHISLIKNLGIGGAVQTGYKYALLHNFDIAVQFDGDGQHDIAHINNVVSPIIEEGFDLVIGSRFIDKESSLFQTTFLRRVGIRIISQLIKLTTKKKIFDVTSGYRAANKNVIQLFADRYPISYPEPESIVHLIKKKYRVTERPVNMLERQGGVSSIRSFKSILYMIEVGTAILVSSFMREED